MLEALRVRDFRLLWSARLISQFGVWLLVVAVPAHVFALTGSVSATGLTLAAQFLPPVLLGPAAGVLADRWDRRHVMVAAHVGRAAAIGLLLLVGEPRDVWLVYVALLLESLGTVVFRPAAQAHTPAVVGVGSGLSSANALNALSDGVVRLIGGPIGGILYASAGFDVLVWLDVGAYLLAAAAVLCTAPVTDRPGSGKVSLRAGWVFVRAMPLLRRLLVINVLFLGANASLSAPWPPWQAPSWARR